MWSKQASYEGINMKESSDPSVKLEYAELMRERKTQEEGEGWNGIGIRLGEMELVEPVFFTFSSLPSFSSFPTHFSFTHLWTNSLKCSVSGRSFNCMITAMVPSSVGLPAHLKIEFCHHELTMMTRCAWRCSSFYVNFLVMTSGMMSRLFQRKWLYVMIRSE